MQRKSALSQCLLRRAARRVAAVFALLAIHPLTLAQIPQLPHDPELLAKLGRHDFVHISDDNNGRLDLYAVLWMVGQAGCHVNEVDKGLDRIVKYTQYFTTDSRTGEYPSKEFAAIGLVSMLGGAGASLGAFAANPNAMAVAALKDRSGCTAVAKLGGEVLETADHHMKWHADDRGRLAPIMSEKAEVLPATVESGAMAGIYSVKARALIQQQFEQIHATGGQLLHCVYGPTNPDSTGTEQVNFWYNKTALPAREILVLSLAHPLAKLGDTPRARCPGTLEDARRESIESVSLARKAIDPKSLPPEPIPFERVLSKENLALYKSARDNIEKYDRYHDKMHLDGATSAKAAVLANYMSACASLTKAALPNSLPCKVRDQLQASLEDIPDKDVSSEAGTNARPNAEYPISVTMIDAIDLDGTAAGHLFRARLEKPIGDAARAIVPVGSEVLLKATRNARVTNPGFAYLDVVVDHAVVDGKRIDLTCKPIIRPLRTDAVEVFHGREFPIPLKNREVLPGSNLHFWAQVSAPVKQ